MGWLWRETAGWLLAPVILTSVSLLQPGPAAALDFGFGFDGVEGIITGLLDNRDNQQPDRIELTQIPIPGWVSDRLEAKGDGFSVRYGEVTSATYSVISYGRPSPGSSGLIFEDRPPQVFGTLFSRFGAHRRSGAVTFTALPATPAVPAPLPLLGAIAACRFGIRLRQRIRGARSQRHPPA